MSLLENTVVKGIAEAHGVTPGQVLIRYQVDKGKGLLLWAAPLSLKGKFDNERRLSSSPSPWF